MKLKHILLIPLLSLSAFGAVPLAWDDDNPVEDIAKYTVYQKSMLSTGTVTWLRIKDVLPPTSPPTTVRETTVITSKTITVTVTVWSKNGIESLRSNELILKAPLPVRNLR